jgi:hypothetical protein
MIAVALSRFGRHREHLPSRNRLFPLARLTIGANGSIVRGYESDIERDRKSYTEVVVFGF